MPGLSRIGRSHVLIAAAVVSAIASAHAWHMTERPLAAREVALLLAAKLLFIGLVSAFAVGALATVQAMRAHDMMRRREARLRTIFFATYLAWFGGWLFALWPGLVVSDTYGVLTMLGEMQIHAWFAYVHTMLYFALLQAVEHVAMVGVFQVIAGAALCACSAGYLLARNRVAGWIFVALTLTSLPLAANIISYHLDLEFTLLFAAVLLVVFRLIHDRSEPGDVRNSVLIWLAVGIAFTAAYRGEAALLVVLVPLALRVPRVISWRQVGLTAAVAFALFFVVVKPGASLVYRLSNTRHIVAQQKLQYPLTLRLNPLGYILQRPYHLRDPQLLNDVARVVGIDTLKELSIPYENPIFWDGRYNTAMTPDDFAAFDRAFKVLAVDNLPLFLASRTHTFLSSFGISPNPTFYFTDYARDPNGSRTVCPGTCTSVPVEPLNESLFERAKTALIASKTFQGATLKGAFLHWNLLPALALLMLCLCLYAVAPATCMAAAIVAIRCLVVFVAAPASQFKYYLILYVFGLMAPAMLWLELDMSSRLRTMLSELRRVRLELFRRAE